MQVNATLHTDGTGYWSTRKAAVKVTDVQLQYVNEEEEFGELVVVFDTTTWDCKAHGLIYTDNLFMQELCDLLEAHGLAGDDVSYSEQGMQGEEFVSCDVNEKFIASYKAKCADEYAALYKELYEDED